MANAIPGRIVVKLRPWNGGQVTFFDFQDSFDQPRAAVCHHAVYHLAQLVHVERYVLVREPVAAPVNMTFLNSVEMYAHSIVVSVRQS